LSSCFVWTEEIEGEKNRTDEQHHVIAATQTLLYDTNSLDAENTEALIGARRAVALIKELPPLVRFLPSFPSHLTAALPTPPATSRHDT
jgi:hypothetical protein